MAAIKASLLSCAIVLALSFGALGIVLADSATWNLNPVSSDWNTAENWTPASVPNGPGDVATFGASNITEVTVSTSVEVNSIVFDSGASPFTIYPRVHVLTLSGGGVMNNSGITQNFVINASTAGNLYFEGSATAGDSLQYTLNGGVSLGTFGVSFFDNSAAATATFILNGGIDLTNKYPGQVSFWDDSSAGNATIILNGGGNGANGADAIFNENSTASRAHIFANGATEENGFGAVVLFDGTTTGDQAVITVGGSDVAGPGIMSFTYSATAAKATLIANQGKASGGVIEFSFLGNPSGGTAKVKLHGNSTLRNFVDRLDIGSLEGDGVVSLLTGSTLEVGSDGRNTTFSGTIENTPGSFVKIGPGTLTLTGASSHRGGTRIEDGKLVVNNEDGSGTGTGQVQVNGGILGGKGIIAGPTTIGIGSGPGAFLAPAGGTRKIATLTIQSPLTFNSDATYTYTYRAKKNTAKTDLVVANGVTINSGATLDFDGTINGRLTPGLVFTVISNTSRYRIIGTFSNLPDGSTVVLAGNTFQANYRGGDGNDLTLTVVP